MEPDPEFSFIPDHHAPPTNFSPLIPAVPQDRCLTPDLSVFPQLDTGFIHPASSIGASAQVESVGLEPLEHDFIPTLTNAQPPMLTVPHGDRGTTNTLGVTEEWLDALGVDEEWENRTLDMMLGDWLAIVNPFHDF